MGNFFEILIEVSRLKVVSKISLVIILSLALLLSGCNSDTKGTKQKKRRVIVAKLQTTTTRLYYKGTLEPINITSVLSPVQGRIVRLYFAYGDTVEKGQKLVVINSTKLADQYRESVSKYLQAKNAYEASKQSFQGAVALHKAGIISDDAFTNAKNQHETAALNYFQAKYELEKALKKAGLEQEKIEELSISDIKILDKKLRERFSNFLVTAPIGGVALFPTKDQPSSSDTSDGSSNGGGGGYAKLVVGSEVAEGKLILSIGDLSGFSTTLQVGENNINRIKKGLKAIVTGSAFPNIVLHGVVTSVAKQANPSQGGGNGGSTFNIVVKIPHITSKQSRVIHVGMTAQVEIDIKNKPQILLPIAAVFEKDGKSMVTIVDDKTGKPKNVSVVTGDTTLTGVVILRGVKAGNKVIIHD